MLLLFLTVAQHESGTLYVNHTKPIYYYIGTRLGQILHARLRMQCSSLNHHLYRTKTL